MRREAIVASDLMRSAYRRIWWAFMLRGLVALALGVFILARPLDSIAALALVVAFWALFTGFIELIHAFELRSIYRQWWAVLLGGLISVGFGIAALYYYPQLSLTFAVLWTAWWLFLAGALAISISLMQRKLGMGWGWTLAFGLVSLGAGLIALMSPPATLAAILGLIAGFAIVSGVVLIMTALRLSSLKDKLGQAVATAALCL